ncbi:MAG: hypothetical protein GY820_42100 [Gammaproteobacteria bacterium]|nr:hypothetical protein [Gammaproteobacteria bacterium]
MSVSSVLCVEHVFSGEYSMLAASCPAASLFRGELSRGELSRGQLSAASCPRRVVPTPCCSTMYTLTQG